MISVTVRQLEYFQAIAEEGSATSAAKRLHVSQAGLSAAIRQMEAAVGVQLFVREKSKTLALSPAGRHISEQVDSILMQLRMLESSVKDVAVGSGGIVTLGCLNALSISLLPGLAEYIQTHHPDISLRVVEGTYSEIDGSLRRGEVDAILDYQEHLSADLTITSIGKQPMYVIMPKGHPLRDLDQIEPKDLAGFPYILLDVAPMVQLVASVFKAAGERLEPLIAVRSNETVRALVARGLGIAITSIRPYRHESVEGMPVEVRPLNFETGFRQISLGRIPEQRLTENLQIVVEYLRSFVRTEM